MFKKIKNEAVAEFKLCADGPVLISSGKSCKTNPTLPDSIFLTGATENEQNVFVIPGSSIKGVIRTYVEDYFKTDKVEELFGRVKDTALRSKVSFHDAYADMSTVVDSIRNSTAINKISQSASNSSLNNMQVVEKGEFDAGFKIVNYEENELETIIKALMAVDDGELFFGGKTSRGFGRMKIKDFRIKINNGFDENLMPKITEFDSFDKVIEYLRNGEK